VTGFARLTPASEILASQFSPDIGDSKGQLSGQQRSLEFPCGFFLGSDVHADYKRITPFCSTGDANGTRWQARTFLAASLETTRRFQTLLGFAASTVTSFASIKGIWKSVLSSVVAPAFFTADMALDSSLAPLVLSGSSTRNFHSLEGRFS